MPMQPSPTTDSSTSDLPSFRTFIAHLLRQRLASTACVPRKLTQCVHPPQSGSCVLLARFCESAALPGSARGRLHEGRGLRLEGFRVGSGGKAVVTLEVARKLRSAQVPHAFGRFARAQVLRQEQLS